MPHRPSRPSHREPGSTTLRHDVALAGFRLAFGALMSVYSAHIAHLSTRRYVNFGQATPGGFERYDFGSLAPAAVVEWATAFPWVAAPSHAAWHAHGVAMAACAAVGAVGWGAISRVAFGLFAALKLVLTLQDTNDYTNHEYLYALVAAALATTGAAGAHSARREQRRGGEAQSPHQRPNPQTPHRRLPQGHRHRRARRHRDLVLRRRGRDLSHPRAGQRLGLRRRRRRRQPRESIQRPQGRRDHIQRPQGDVPVLSFLVPLFHARQRGPVGAAALRRERATGARPPRAR